jgi:hypothetical protein
MASECTSSQTDSSSILSAQSTFLAKIFISSEQYTDGSSKRETIRKTNEPTKRESKFTINSSTEHETNGETHKSSNNWTKCETVRKTHG